MQENNNNSAEKDIEFDVLTEIGNIGAGNATTAFYGDVINWTGLFVFIMNGYIRTAYLYIILYEC